MKICCIRISSSRKEMKKIQHQSCFGRKKSNTLLSGFLIPYQVQSKTERCWKCRDQVKERRYREGEENLWCLAPSVIKLKWRIIAFSFDLKGELKKIGRRLGKTFSLFFHSVAINSISVFFYFLTWGSSKNFNIEKAVYISKKDVFS